jgi:molybdate/tungstate transport system ATP-binding protein
VVIPDPRPPKTQIRLESVSLRLGDFAVHDVSFDVAAGEYFVLLGPTGAGKTVLLECLAGLHPPDRGHLFLGGVQVNALPPERRRVGYLPQDYALFPHLDVAGNIAFGMRLQRRSRQHVVSRVAELAQLLGISHLLARSTQHLSGGEQQRVALARAIAIEPQVLLLDEPLSALDEQMREGLCGELRRLHTQLGTTTIHVSHNFEETLAVADRVGVIHDGRLQQVGPAQQVFRRPANEFVARFMRCENILPGVARRTSEGIELQMGRQVLRAGEGPTGPVRVVIRPEDIELGVPSPSGLAGVVRDVVDLAALVRIDVQVGELSLVALMGRREFRRAGLAVGATVSVWVDPEAVHLMVSG